VRAAAFAGAYRKAAIPDRGTLMAIKIFDFRYMEMKTDLKSKIIEQMS
jgi:hypothetical protein